MNTKVELASAYVDPDEVVLKPENLDKLVPKTDTSNQQTKKTDE